ncbi:UNVERIFIED_CONTAM: BTB/POZ domain-containing protein [Sesamum latifolium]|uniref:BTB/POZ domain-containing protein n=1 Tax=Sesamum latifolium TaxID=2727402 RepID=A0AAW2Y6R9_9LAMI
MAEIRLPRLEQGQTKIKNVPIAVTPEGFWCCPSPVVFQKTTKTQNPQNKLKSSAPTQNSALQRKPNSANEKKSGSTSSRTNLVTDEQKSHSSDPPVLNAPSMNEKAPRPKLENVPRKVTIEFGEPGTSDLRVILLGKQGLAVKLSVHRSVLVENSSFFASKISEQQPVFPCLEIDNCDDGDICRNYWTDVLQRTEAKVDQAKFHVCSESSRKIQASGYPDFHNNGMRETLNSLRIITKVGEQLGFTTCIQSCLEYLEAVPWVGEEEEEKVVSSVLRLESEGIGVRPVLKRVSSDISKTPKDTLSHILELVLKSKEEKGRREMKSVVLKLLRENNNLPSSSDSSDLCNETLYSSCRNSLDSLLSLFRQAAEPDFAAKPIDSREPVVKLMAIEADNLLWLLDILADRQAADEFAITWANQQELASLHSRLPIVSRHHVSTITARLFVGIGRGELLPSKDTRHLLLKTWLEPLINDYSWLQHGCRSFDRKVVEEGIGRTILTLP